MCASSEGHRYLRNRKDVFSNRFEAIPLSNMTSEKVLRALQMLYARFGYPLQVHTDNATYFRSLAMQEASQRAGVQLTFTPTYNPQSNSSGKDSPRPQHHVAFPVSPTCGRLGGSATCHAPRPPQSCPREHGSHSIRVPVWTGASDPAGLGE